MNTEATVTATPFTPEQLRAAVSPETAITVEDYPYGFRLRCRWQAWIEYRKGHGFRMVTRTSNPKRGNVWNKPKAGTYSRVALALYVDDAGHVQSAGLTNYASLAELRAFATQYNGSIGLNCHRSLIAWEAVRVAHADAFAAGTNPTLAAVAAIKEQKEAGRDYF